MAYNNGARTQLIEKYSLSDILELFKEHGVRREIPCSVSMAAKFARMALGMASCKKMMTFLGFLDPQKQGFDSGFWWRHY
jgi:hypothetical protein